jgi:alcohol dehydrogenase (cytochrome c)
VIDRTNGEFLSGKQFVDAVTWATGIDNNGRPIRVDGMEPSEEGNEACPSLLGATNWFSTTYSEETGLYYMQTREACDVFTKRENEGKAGKGYFEGSRKNSLNKDPRKVLRALDIETGEAVWELPQEGLGGSWGGVLGTASGLIIFADDSGALAAADARTDEALWHFQTNVLWKESLMTYLFDGTQYIAIASSSNILSFGLVD